MLHCRLVEVTRFPTFDTYTPRYTEHSGIYPGTGTQAVATGFNYGYLAFSGSSTKTVSSALAVLSGLSLSSGTFNGGSHTHTLKGQLDP